MIHERQFLLRKLVVLLLILLLSIPQVTQAENYRSSWAQPLGISQAGETCITVQPGPTAGKDAYIKQDKPDERWGSGPELRVKTENGKLNRALLQFDLPGLPAGAIIHSATLSLYVKDASGGAVTINAHRVTASWNEAQVTWKARDKAANLLWASQGGDFDPAVVGATVVDDTKNVWRSWDVTSLVSAWYGSPASNFGLILESPVTTPKTEKVFKSSDDGTASQRPKLQICYSAGVTIDPDNSGEGVAGQTRTYAHMVHVGNLTAEVVNLSAVSDQGWSTRIYEDENGNGIKDPEDDLIGQTPPLGPYADYPILVQVDVPLGVFIGTVDVTTVTATGQASGASDTATDRTRVGKLLNVQPDHSQYATAGTVLFYGHTITNNGQSQDCVTVSASSSQGWGVQLWEDTNKNGVHEAGEPALSSPVCIGSGETYYLVAEVQVPAAASAGTVDHTVITATSGNEPAKSDSATDTTEVFVNAPPVIDGRYDDIYKISPDATEVCYTSGGVLFGKLATFYQAGGDAVYVVLAIDKDFVDNTYGVNAVGWPSGHTFSQLVGSDHAQFLGYDASDTKVLDFKLDYITAKSGTPSGYASLGVSGGDGKMNLGSAAHILQWGTSLEYSLNSTGYCSGGNCSGLGTNLLVDSPATDEFYTPNPTYPDWVFDVIYEVKIDSAAFVGGFGAMEIPYIHASPSKIGENTIYAEPGVCPGEIGDFVWHDLDHDGVQDAGEPGIDGVQVKLYQDNGDGVFDPGTDTVVGTKTTSAGGKYLFQNLVPGDYFVDVVDATVPVGYVITTFNDPTPLISLDEGESYLAADFGYTEPFAELEISKTLSSDPPLYVGQEISFTIRITNTGLTLINVLPLQDWYDPDTLDYLGATPPADDNVDDGVLDWSDLTVSFGQNLLPGQAFEVVVRFRAVEATDSLMLGSALSPLAAQAEPLVDGRLDSSYTYLTHLSTGDGSSGGNLYGYQGGSMCYWAYVTDRAFNDNVYAESDSAYLLLDGWMVGHKFSNLLNSDNAAFNVTYPGGSYSNLTLDYLKGSPGAWSSGQTGGDGSKAPGTPPISDAMTSLHWNMENSNWNGGPWGDPLKHSPPYDYNATSGNTWEWAMIYEFSIPRSQMNGQCGTVTLASQHNSPSKYQSDKGRIGDRVWEDADGDTLQDAGEVGLPGVTVNLYQGSTLVRTTQTEPGSSGYYIFVNLSASSYRVDVDESTLPPDYVLTTHNEPMDVTIASGASFLDADFGYWLAGHGSIGDRVFYDLNGDGLPDDDGNEPGINGVTVRLYAGDCPPSGNPLRTQVTAGNGDYDFINLLPGTYCVDVDESTLPVGYTLTTGNEPLTVILADDQDYNDADFGYRVECVDGTADVAMVSGAEDEYGSRLPDIRDDVCVEILPVGKLGDFVWWDMDYDGEQDAGEPGLADVLVNLYDGLGTKIATDITDGSGLYLFENLPPDTYRIEIEASEFQPGGTLYNWVASPQNAPGVPDDRDSDGHPVSHDVTTTLAAGEVDLSNDFGFYIVSDYAISKTLNTTGTVYRNTPVSFTVCITNTGNTWIRILPLRDVYSTTYLTYGYTDTLGVATFADPDSDDHHNDGVIEWSDLTVTEGDLAPGASVTVVITFTAREDTTLLPPDGKTENTAVVHEAWADPDGEGPWGPEIPLPEKGDSDRVRIETPTAVEGVVLASLRAEALPEGVWLTWETADETNILGFNVLRRAGEGGESMQVNEEFIFAAGAGLGAVYEVWDEGVIAGERYEYWLEVQMLDGTTVWHELGSVEVRWWRWLPVVVG